MYFAASSDPKAVAEPVSGLKCWNCGRFVGRQHAWSAGQYHCAHCQVNGGVKSSYPTVASPRATTYPFYRLDIEKVVKEPFIDHSREHVPCP